MRFLALFLCLTCAGFGAELVVFSSGARLSIERHETEGRKVKLYKDGGYIELDATLVQGFEVDDRPAKPVAEPAAAVPPVEPPPAAELKAPSTIHEMADAAADRYNLPRKLVHSVIQAESAYQPNAISPKGAIGPMQLMPATARQLGVDPHDPVQNIDGGVRYLRDLLERYDHGLWHALAAYNAGPGAVDKYNGIPPYRETINYVNKIDRKFRE